MKSCSHIFALITACVFLFCGCSDYLSLSKASTISNPQTEYDTALKEYLASLETPLSTIEIKHGEDTPIVWEDTGMEAAVRLLLNRPEGTISRSDVWNLNTLTITERTMFEGDSGTTTIVTVTAQQGDATLEQEISAVGKESPLPALASLHDLQYFDSLQAFSYSTSPTANQAFTDFSGIETMSHLERFSVNGARPETLEPLSHLSQLKQLSLTECGTLDLTPLEGLIMGTRSGDLDPAVLQFICNHENIDINEMLNILNKKSGILGMSGGISSDFRDVEKAGNEGNHLAEVALEAFRYRVIKYIGAYTAAMNGVDAIAFTAGGGENDALARKLICENLAYLGVKIDEEANNVRGEERVISAADSKVKVMLIPTNEELAIARETLALVK